MNLLRAVWEYLEVNAGIYLFVSAFFLLGIVSGALMVRYLGEEQLTELHETLSLFLISLRQGGLEMLEPPELLRASLWKNVRYLLLVWVLGLFWLGFPLVLVLLALKGLAIGFTVGLMVHTSSFQGVVFSLAAVLPHNLVLVPAYIAAAATAVTLSLLKLKYRLAHGGKNSSNEGRYFKQYCLLMLLFLFFILLGGLVEAYITPVFMRLAVGIM